VSHPFVYKLFYAFYCPHGKKKKSKTNDGGNKRLRKAIDLEEGEKQLTQHIIQVVKTHT